MSARSRAWRGAAAIPAALLVACARPPAPAPAPVTPAANPAAPVVSPRSARGVYDLVTTLHVTPRGRPSRSRRSRRPPPAMLRLDFQPLAAPDATAASSTQLSALVSIPGYTRAPSGRTGQAAAWWPLPGDSVVVHFQSAAGDGAMELRGVLSGDSLAGAVWFMSASSGSTYQLGTFLGVKRRRR